jgi:hypothetical protein
MRVGVGAHAPDGRCASTRLTPSLWLGPARMALGRLPDRPTESYSDDFAIFWMTHCPPALFKLPQNWAASSVDPNGPTMVR